MACLILYSYRDKAYEYGGGEGCYTRFLSFISIQLGRNALDRLLPFLPPFSSFVRASFFFPVIYWAFSRLDGFRLLVVVVRRRKRWLL